MSDENAVLLRESQDIRRVMNSEVINAIQNSGMFDIEGEEQRLKDIQGESGSISGTNIRNLIKMSYSMGYSI